MVRLHILRVTEQIFLCSCCRLGFLPLTRLLARLHDSNRIHNVINNVLFLYGVLRLWFQHFSGQKFDFMVIIKHKVLICRFSWSAAYALNIFVNDLKHRHHITWFVYIQASASSFGGTRSNAITFSVYLFCTV